MIAAFSAYLEACDPERNRWRSYHVEAGRDLLGDWLVEVTFGRIGARGRTVRYVTDDELAARRRVLTCLRRRASAPKRIGIGYRTCELVDPAGWLQRASRKSLSSTANDGCGSLI